MTVGTVLFLMLPGGLAGCRHAPTSGEVRSATGWHVLERVGEVRAAGEQGGPASRPRPGETITGPARVTSGGGALLILQKDGVQITAGEQTIFHLPASASDAGLLLDQGWLRLRLATAINRKMRVKTAHFDINTSNTTFTLRRASHGSDLTVEAGSVTLATSDGLHHARLVAGAAAKIERASGDELLIRKALGGPFVKVDPLPAKARHRDGDPGVQEGNTIEASAATAPPPARSPDVSKAAHLASAPSKAASVSPRAARAVASTIAGDPVILPASQPKDQVGHRPTWQDRDVFAQPPPVPLPTLSLQEKQTRLPEPPALQRGAAARPMTGSPHPARALETSSDRASASDPIQTKFDRLTAGLVDGL